ncbi:MAG: hypothetical protein K1060chlam2_01218, partial [Chlamydiae bacterium]|nr:hypothetical protein [Chlamydiota bacterium]
MRILLLLFFPLTLFAFVIDPWLTTLAEFEFRSAYSYRTYPSVDRGFNPESYHSHDHLIDLNLGLRFLPNWEGQLEADFSKTRRLSWGTERIGVQLRTLLLDDVAGDPVSLTVGGQLFYVPTRNMHDVSSPYHAQGNVELGVAIGKEIDSVHQWLYRFYGFLGVGSGNRGYPWLRPLLSVEMKHARHHKFQLFSKGYIGLGRRSQININQFNGYSKIQHRSIDLGANYTYLFDIWGALGVQYSFRVYA